MGQATPIVPGSVKSQLRNDFFGLTSHSSAPKLKPTLLNYGNNFGVAV